MKDATRILFLCMIVACMGATAYSQSLTTVTGTVKNATTNEFIPAVSVTIKNLSVGAYTDEKGNFKFTTTEKLPFTLIISSVGYGTKEIEYTTSGQALDISLEASYALGQDIVVAATRLPQRILEAPVTIERVNSTTIRNAPGESYYTALGNLKGVDVTTSSYTFKTVSTRGFNGSGNLRFNQLVDGMDNTAPALNFSVGNVIGLTELDVDNMELLSGASSALYGSGGMNGTLLINSKNPFKYQGVSFQIKQGVMHINDSRHSASPFYDWSLRWGKKLSDKFAFKIGAEYIKADDWRANDTTNLLRTNVISRPKEEGGTRASDPNYDGVNVFGDEASTSMQSFAQVFQGRTRAGILEATGGAIDIVQLMDNSLPDHATPDQIAAFIGGLPPALQPPVQQLVPFYFGLRNDIYGPQYVSRTGYYEKDFVDYDAFNLKFSAGLYYKLNTNTEASLTGNWGSGTSVYTGADRYSLKNFTIGQYKLEFRSKNWFFRAYTTQENSGDSYASTLAALSVNNAWKSNATWFGQYVGVYSGYVLAGQPSNVAHAAARGVADAERYIPGSQQFKDAFNKAITTPITASSGAQFADNSDLWQFEGQLNLSQYIKVVDVLVGASYRWYNIDSKGTIFADTSGPIKINEYGGYIQLQKTLLKDVLKLTASGRYDKNENFDGRFTPRVTASVKVAKDNNIRISYQQAYRFPNNQDQWINLQTPASILIGCLPGFKTHYNFEGNPVYTIESVVAYRATVAAGSPNPTLLQVAEFKTAKPETVESFELGYRGIVATKLLIDAYIYTSKYKDFIGRSAVARGYSGVPAAAPIDLANPLTSVNFSFVENSPTPVKAIGWGIGIEYQLKRGYKLMGNIASDKLRDVPKGLITFFNAPEYRYNIGISNSNAYKGFGFNVIYKWQDKVNWEGTFAAGEIPSFGTVDAQVSYKLGKTNNLIKIGATNLFNDYYRSAFGNPYVGGLYYISFGYNVF